MAEKSFHQSALVAYKAASGIANLDFSDQVALPALPEFNEFHDELHRLEPAYRHLKSVPGLYGRRNLKPEVIFVPHNTTEVEWNEIIGSIAVKNEVGTRGLETFYDNREKPPEYTRWEPAVINGSGRPGGHADETLQLLDVKKPSANDLLPSLDSYLALQTKRMFLGQKPVDTARPPSWTKLADTGRPSSMLQNDFADLFKVGDIHLRGSWDTGLTMSQDFGPDWEDGINVSSSVSYQAPRIIVAAGKVGLSRLFGLSQGWLRPTFLASQV